MANSTDKIFLDGTTYVKFPVTDSLYDQKGVFVDFTLDLEDWGKPSSSQIVGNYNSAGYGVFYEKGIQDVNDFTIIDSGNSHMFYFNQSGGLVSQRNFTDQTNPVNITAFVVDHLGYKYYFDQGNQLCSKFDSNNLLIDEFVLDPDVVISNMTVNSRGDVYFVDTNSSSVLRYTALGELVSTEPLDFPSHNNIVILPDNSIKSFFSSNNTRMLADVEGNYYNHFGVNIYRNGLPWFFVSPLFNSFGLDLEDNIWVVYEGNRIMKLDSDGVKQFDKTFHQFSSCDTTTCPPKGAVAEKVSIGFTTESLQDEQVVYTWVLLNESGYAVKLDENGVVLDCFLIANMLDINAYPNTAYENISISVNGDFTGFYARKSFNENRLTESYIVSKVAVQDLVTTEVYNYTLRYNASQMSIGEHQIGFIYDGGSGDGVLYIDGAEVDSFQHLGVIYYDRENLPPVLIGAESGNYRAKKEELGIIDPVYFAGTISNLVISKQYNELVQKSRTLTPLNLEMSTGYPLSFKERVESLFLFRPKGMYSSRHNLNIRNSSIDDQEVRDLVVSDILLAEEQSNPTQTKINNIEWVSEFRIGNISPYEPEPPLPIVAIIMEIDTAFAGHTGSDQFAVKTRNAESNDLVIDWGDGTGTERFIGVEPPTHTYTDGGSVHTVTLMGTLDSIYYDSEALDINKITSVDFIGGTTGDDHSYGMDGATNLTSINNLNIPSVVNGVNMFGSSSISEITGTVDLSSLEDGEDMFYDNNLTWLPDTFTLPSLTNGRFMFLDNSLTTLPDTMTLDSLIDGYRMFRSNEITTLPDSLVLNNLIYGYEMFYNNSLTRLPDIFTLPSLTDGQSMFRFNYNLSTLPDTFALPALTNGGFMFSYNNLSTLPDTFTLPSLTDGQSMFENNNITSLPSGMTLDNLTDGQSMFENNNITSLPSGLTLDNLTDGEDMFVNNNFTTIPSGMSLDNLTKGDNMFSNVPLTSISDLSLTKLTRGWNMFENNNITSLPSGMTLDNLTDGWKMFENNNFTSLPSGMTLDNLTKGSDMFLNVPLTSISDLSLTKLIQAPSMFKNNNITSLPSGMTLDNLTDGRWMFTNNNFTTLPTGMTLDNLSWGNNMFSKVPLTSISDLSLTNLTNGENMFNGASFEVEEYSDFLIRMEAANTNSNVKFHGGLGSKYNTDGEVARTALVNRGWEITDGGLVAEYANTIIADNPVSYWRLQDEAGSTVAVDEMGTMDGIYVGSPQLEHDESGTIGGVSVNLNGTSHWVEIPHTSELQPTAAVSIEQMVYKDDWSDNVMENCGPSSRTDVSTNAGWTITRNYNNPTTHKVYFELVLASGPYGLIKNIPTSDILSSGWHHFVGTYDKNVGEMKFYIDGVLIGQQSTDFSIRYRTRPLYLGTTDTIAGSSLAGRAFEGRIRDAAIYNYALSQEQVTNHFSQSGI